MSKIKNQLNQSSSQVQEQLKSINIMSNAVKELKNISKNKNVDFNSIMAFNVK